MLQRVWKNENTSVLLVRKYTGTAIIVNSMEVP